MSDDSQNPDNPDKESLERLVSRLSDGFNHLVNGTPLPSVEESDFFRAVKNNRAEDVTRMLAEGFDPNAYNAEGLTPLHIAARRNAKEVIEALLAKGADPNRGRKGKPEMTPVMEAVQDEKPETVAFLLETGCATLELLEDGKSLLHRACEKGRTRIVDVLLEAGVDPAQKTANGATPLMLAVRYEHAGLIKKLLEFPVTLETLGASYSQADPKKRTAFHMAVDRDLMPIVSLMLDKGAPVNQPDAEGKTPLLYALESFNMEMIRLLIEHGADINKPCGPAGTALVYAAKTEKHGYEPLRAEIVDLLVRMGADTDIPSAEGLQPLHYLISSPLPPPAFATLLQYPVDINGRRAGDARTPLIEAARNNTISTVQTLLDAGADPKLVDKDGKSALAYAQERGQKEIISLIERALSEKPDTKPPSPPAGPAL